jgi:signal peptidase II
MKWDLSKKMLNTVFLSSSALVLLADQITKYWINIMPEEAFPITLVSSVLYITRVTNTGIAFGLFQDIMNILIVISIIAVILIILLKIKLRLNSLLLNLGLGFLLGGTLGNLVDRVLFREVTDFISISFFAVFNVADSFINIGFALIAVVLIRFYIKRHHVKGVD